VEGVLDETEASHTLPVTVKLDWLNSASGAAGWLVEPVIALEPEPPVRVSVPLAKRPFSRIGKARTALSCTLVRTYIAFPFTFLVVG
jgi:hypothetical protein